MNKPSIIIVDNAQKEVSGIIAFAEEIGFRCIFCSSTVEGRQKWEAERGFDVVILDLNLAAEGEGLEFIYTTSASPGMRLPTVFVYSGYVEKFKSSLRVLLLLGLIHAYDKGDHRDEEKLKAALKEHYQKLTTRPGSRPV